MRNLAALNQARSLPLKHILCEDLGISNILPIPISRLQSCLSFDVADLFQIILTSYLLQLA